MKEIRTLLAMARQAKYFNNPLRQFLVRRAVAIRAAARQKKMPPPETTPE